MVVPGMLHMSIVRASVAHAKITNIDASAALAKPNIVAVFTGDDFDASIPMFWAPPDVEIKTPVHPVCAKGEVKHVWQAVAVVVGTDKYATFDAAREVVVDYEELPVVVDPEEALKDGAPLVWPEFGTNKTHRWSIGGGDAAQALQDA